MEVIAAAVKSEGGFSFKATNPSLSSKIRISNIEDDEVFYFNEEDLKEHYAYKLDLLENYNVSKEIERSRNLEVLDRFRSQEFPDDVFVYMIKDENNIEKCCVRIEGLSDPKIFGILLNEPEQDFSCHKGDSVEFIIHQTKEGELIPILNI